MESHETQSNSIHYVFKQKRERGSHLRCFISRRARRSRTTRVGACRVRRKLSCQDGQLKDRVADSLEEEKCQEGTESPARASREKYCVKEEMEEHVVLEGETERSGLSAGKQWHRGTLHRHWNRETVLWTLFHQTSSSALSSASSSCVEVTLRRVSVDHLYCIYEEWRRLRIVTFIFLYFYIHTFTLTFASIEEEKTRRDL